MHYGEIGNLKWMWIVAIIGGIIIFTSIRHRKAIRQFATDNLLQDFLPQSSTFKRILASALSLTGLALIVIALVDIRWGEEDREVPQRGIEVMFVLDVSRSMLAEDVAPNRLERAKQDIRDMLQAMNGDRVGLVLFAGEVRQFIPLTNHYEDFRQNLEEVGPYNLNRGGSNLAQAITLASDAFIEKSNDHKAIVLITDGEDQDSNPQAIAQKAFDQSGIRIFTIGIGDESIGARIPNQSRNSRDAYVEYNGQQVWSKLNGEVLEKIAKASDGVYIPAGTKRVDMTAVYNRFIGSIAKKNFDTARISTFAPRYQWFLGAALCMFLAEYFIMNPPSLRKRKDKPEARSFADGLVRQEVR